jgi:hypothetical protein
MSDISCRKHEMPLPWAARASLTRVYVGPQSPRGDLRTEMPRLGRGGMAFFPNHRSNDGVGGIIICKLFTKIHPRSLSSTFSHGTQLSETKF